MPAEVTDMRPVDLRWMMLIALPLGTWACDPSGGPGPDGGDLDSGTTRDGGAFDAGMAGDGGPIDSGMIDSGPGTLPPVPLEPCEMGRPDSCWSALTSTGACGTSTLNEDFVTNLYNVHTFSVAVRAGVDAEITLRRTGGAWEPALVLHDDTGATIYDGERGLVSPTLTVTAVSTGRGADVATVRISSATDVAVLGFLTGWHVIDGAFLPRMPMAATYALTILTDCPPPTGLLTPPNFDEGDVVGGYYILPPSDPAGLYTRKERCSRGNRLLIEVLYTVAVRWAELRPGYSPISITDLNECDPRLPGDADHATHDDGTHADLSAGCATRVGCDIDAAIDLAKLFVDTGEVCGIIFNDDAVQAVVNPYFLSEYSYTPWHGGAARTFMRTVAGHTAHFHIRVMRPDGTCAPLT